MHLKYRTVLIIILSSVIISSVLTLTIFGFYAYLEWKSQTTRRNYQISLHDINAELFSKYIAIELEPKIDKEGVFQDKPILEGAIKNTSDKAIYSLRLRIAFRDNEHRVVHVDHFYPIGPGFRSFLRGGDTLSFKYRLKNCPQKVTDYLDAQLRFAKDPGPGQLELVYKIEGIDIK